MLVFDRTVVIDALKFRFRSLEYSEIDRKIDKKIDRKIDRKVDRNIDR